MAPGILAGMPSPVEDLKLNNPAAGEGWMNEVCPHCGVNAQMFVIAWVKQQSPHHPTGWARCVNCFRGVVLNQGLGMAPASLPLDVPQGLEDDAAATWEEARTCLGAGAYTASVMMCRKLLMHMAVEEGLPKKDGRGHAPNFFECLDHLEAEAVISKRNKSWADRIRTIGNEANHDLASIDKEQATTVATFTRQLLHEVYELPFLETNT